VGRLKLVKMSKIRTMSSKYAVFLALP